MTGDGRMARRPIIALGAWVLVAVMAAPVAAQPQSNKLLAESLFQEGKELLKADDWLSACAKFEKSMELDPAVGTQLKIASCREHDGKLAQAWYAYQHALKLTRELSLSEKRRAELEAYTRQAIAALEPRIPKLRLLVPARPEGLRVTLDGQELAPAVFGEELPVDVGERRVAASAPGHRSVEHRVSMTETEKRDVELVLEPEPTPAPVPAPPAPVAIVPPPQPAPPTPPPAPREESATPVEGWVLVGVGIAAAVAGGVLVALAEESAQEVRGHTGDWSAVEGEYDKVTPFRIAGGVLIGAGAIGVTLGTVLVATAGGRSDEAQAPRWAPAGAALRSRLAR
jgi:hypothetical protein